MLLSYLLFHLVSAPVAILAMPFKLPKPDPGNDPGEGGEQPGLVEDVPAPGRGIGTR